MNRRCLLVVFMLFAQALTFGQSCKISGIVLDTLGQPIEGAVVISMEPVDSVMVEFSSTDLKGHFKLGRFRKDSLLIQVSYLGFAPYYKVIFCKGKDINLLIRMQSEEMLLQTVIVKEERIPIKMNGDTVQYDARAFRVKPGEVVEDLLKKMPGIEVDENGDVKAMGKKVEKVMVDGKEFFGSDPKMATKNIPADAIKNVKVYDKKTDDETFTKTDDGKEEMTIDLELKNDRKVGGFGLISAAGGSKERYAAKGNYFRFAPKVKYSLIGMSNNTNQTGYSINDMISFGGGMSALRTGGLTIDGTLPFANEQDGLWKTHSGAGSFSFFGDHLELSATLSAFQQNSLSTVDEEKELFLKEDEKYFLNGSSEGRTNSDKYLGRVKLKYEIDSTQQLSFSAKYVVGAGYDAKDLKEWKQSEVRKLVSQNTYHSGKEKANTPWQSKVTYRKRFKNNHSLISSIEYHEVESFDNQSVDDHNIFYDADTTYVSIFRELNKGSLEKRDKEYLEYSLPSFKKQKLKIWGSIEALLDKQRLNNALFTGVGFERIDSLSGKYKRDVKRYKYGLRQDVAMGKVSWAIGLAYEQSSLGGAIDDNYLDAKKYLFFLPSLECKLQITGSSSLKFNYTTSQKLPQLKEILPIVEVHSASYTYRGNPDLKPAENHHFELKYNNYNRFNGRVFHGNLKYSYYRNPIVYARKTDTFYRQEVTPINTPKKSILSGFIYYQMKIPFLKAKLSLNSNGNLMHGMSILNDEQFASISSFYSIGIGMANSKKKIYDFGIKTKIQVRNSETQSKSATALNYAYIGHFSVTMPKGVELETKGTAWYYPDTQFESFPKPSVSWTISKSFAQSKKWLVAISGYDMFGRSDGYKQRSDVFEVSTTRTENVGRYFLLKLSYKI